ncbi:PREDICTED: uncharacterized protein LOC100640325 [Amphimedon queenslandica]|uniref:DUF5110 domain-containing protein n=2 Tax=Amphimedon queenslandica TaxID=400682 RepID=A0AAN0IDV2_AMPQE|nr:PREDICTED: uncharacterized protein LOC100640325 [Amphimedon queenslandica]|eukprot:XP_003386286.1 PREDICTED: uncharacterized protein LOC100640325 [Amphimedon queenslandica]
MVFIGDAADGVGSLYEDDGVTEGYINNNSSSCNFSYKHDTSKEELTVSIGQFVGTYDGSPSKRSYQIVIPNFWPAEEVQLNSNSLSYCPLRGSFDEYTSDCWTYDGSTLSLIVIIVTPQATSDAVNVQVAYTQFNVFDPYNINININGESKSVGFTGMVRRLRSLKELLDNQWGLATQVYQEDYRSLIDASEAGIRITYSPTDIGSLINGFRDNIEDTYNSVTDLKLNSTLRAILEAQLTLN